LRRRSLVPASGRRRDAAELMRVSKVLCLVIAAGLLSGACSRNKETRCTLSTAYRDAVSANQLRVPGDLSIPDETDALRVPGPPLPGEGAGSSDECLEFSPALQTAQEGQQQSDD
jgi:uncharacterized lipoprotein